jgi:hypothetical protein
MLCLNICPEIADHPVLRVTCLNWPLLSFWPKPATQMHDYKGLQEYKKLHYKTLFAPCESCHIESSSRKDTWKRKRWEDPIRKEVSQGCQVSLSVSFLIVDWFLPLSNIIRPTHTQGPPSTSPWSQNATSISISPLIANYELSTRLSIHWGTQLSGNYTGRVRSKGALAGACLLYCCSGSLDFPRIKASLGSWDYRG